MSFWELVWLIVISFAFVALLMVMFAIITDLIRDSETSGWVKALWFVLLILLPWLTAVVYLIVKGPAMAERRNRELEATRQQQEAYVRSVAGSTSAADQIAQAKSLLDSGSITQAEFDALKQKALA